MLYSNNDHLIKFLLQIQTLCKQISIFFFNCFNILNYILSICNNISTHFVYFNAFVKMLFMSFAFNTFNICQYMPTYMTWLVMLYFNIFLFIHIYISNIFQRLLTFFQLKIWSLWTLFERNSSPYFDVFYQIYFNTLLHVFQRMSKAWYLFQRYLNSRFHWWLLPLPGFASGTLPLKQRLPVRNCIGCVAIQVAWNKRYTSKDVLHWADRATAHKKQPLRTASELHSSACIFLELDSLVQFPFKAVEEDQWNVLASRTCPSCIGWLSDDNIRPIAPIPHCRVDNQLDHPLSTR